MKELKERNKSRLEDQKLEEEPDDEEDHHLAVGDVVIIKSSECNRNQWPLGIVETLIKGTNGVVRAVHLRRAGETG